MIDTPIEEAGIKQHQIKDSFGTRIPKRGFSFIVILLASVCSTLVLYKLFFLFASQIWSMQIKVLPGEVTPAIKQMITQRDGIEGYVLYLLAFVNILLTLFLARIYEHLNLYKKKPISITALYALVVVSIISTRSLLFSVKIIPPMMDVIHSRGLFFIIALVLIATLALLKTASWKTRLADIFIIAALLPVCFIATQPISTIDYSYIFAPALKLINHIRLSDIYFQYDFFLSLLAGVWMKLKIDLNLFQVLGQLSYYVFFLATFFFSKSYFSNKKLPYYFLISLVLIKIYAPIIDPVCIFQVTPLRLDLWILILIIAYKKGIFSKYLGLILAAMIVLDKTFGLIYLAAYLEVIIAMIGLDLSKKIPHIKQLREVLKRYIKLSWENILIIGSSLLASYLIFGGITSGAASMYQQIGIGFMKISQISFYWYIFVLLNLTLVFLMKKREELTEKYFITGIFLIFLAIGNSLYFFGRSHENNIINIAGSLVFVLFLLFDLLSAKYKNAKQDAWVKSKSKLVTLLPIIFILLITYSYSGRIIEKTKTQFHNISKLQLIYPMFSPFDPTKFQSVSQLKLTTPRIESFNTATIKEITKNSTKVYFVGDNDIYYYYYGGYIPEGYFAPYDSWIYKKDLVSFIQGLIKNNYFIVTPEDQLVNQQEILSGLKYSNSIKKGGFLIIWK